MAFEILDRTLHFLFLTSYVWVPLSMLSFVSMWLCRVLGRRVALTLGIIGVPVHEASHLVVAILCGQKITGVSFYRPSSDGSLGYVNRQYRRTFLSPFMNLLIALAPVAGGLLAFAMVTEFFLPGFIDVFHQGFQSGRLNIQTPLAIAMLISKYEIHAVCMWALFSFSILLFCSPSSTDFQGSRAGFIFLLGSYVLLQSFAPNKVDRFLALIAPYVQLFGAVLIVVTTTMLCILLILFGIRWMLTPKVHLPHHEDSSSGL